MSGKYHCTLICVIVNTPIANIFANELMHTKKDRKVLGSTKRGYTEYTEGLMVTILH